MTTTQEIHELGRSRSAAGAAGSPCQRRGRGAVLALAMALALAPVPAARAALVSFLGEGTVVSVADTPGVLDGSVTVGGPIRATVVYDTEPADTLPADPTIGDYIQPVPPASLRIEVGSYAVDAVALQVLVEDGTIAGDSLAWRQEAVAIPFPGAPTASLNFLEVSLGDRDATALASDALPTAIPVLADFPSGQQIAITGCLTADVYEGFFCPSPAPIAIYGMIETLPEPGPAALAAAALLALAGSAALPRRLPRPPRRGAVMP
jgi:hypothetical protein